MKDSLSRRQFAAATLGVGVSATGILSFLSISRADEQDVDQSEEIVTAVEAHYNSEPAVFLDSVNRINRQHLPGDTVVVEVEASNGEHRVFVEDRDNSWEVSKIEPGL